MANEKTIIEAATKTNSLVNIQDLTIPVLDDFVVQQNVKMDSKFIFVATKNGAVEQFLTDGQLIDDEDFEERVEKVLNGIRREVRNNPLYEGNGRYIDFYKFHKTDLFNFKIYIQDILIDKEHFIRQMNAYFVEPKSKEFCQLSLAIGQYLKSEYKLLREIDDLNKDVLIKNLEKAMMIIMDNIVYDYSE